MVSGYSLPDGWKLHSVEELYHVVGGGTPSTSIPEYWTGSIPWITSADIHGLKDIRPRKEITKEAIANSATNLVPAGSLIVVTRVSLGKVALVDFPLCFSQDSQALIAKNKSVFPEYALYYLSKAAQGFIHRSRGTTISGIPKKQLKELTIPLPPLLEQKRIVAKIEELFTQLEAGTASLRRVQAGLKRYKASVLKSACEGRLLEQDPSDEPAEELLRQLGKRPQTDIRLPPLPKRWCWSTIEDLSSDEKYSLAIGPFGSNLKVSDYRSEGVPLIFVRNIRKCNFENTHYVSKEKAFELLAHQISRGDILITKMGEPPGEACLYPDTRPDAIITADCIKWKLSPIFPEKRFFVHIINSPAIQKQIHQITRGVAQKKVSLDRFRRLFVPLPPLEEQRRIVDEVEQRLSVVAEVEAAVEAGLKRAERLRQAILKRAFEGKLVPQENCEDKESRVGARQENAGWIARGEATEL